MKCKEHQIHPLEEGEEVATSTDGLAQLPTGLCKKMIDRLPPSRTVTNKLAHSVY